MCFQFQFELNGAYLWINVFSVSVWVERGVSLDQWVFSFTLSWTGHFSGSMGFQFHFELNGTFLWVNGVSVSLWIEIEQDISLGQWVFSFTLSWTGRISGSMGFQFHFQLNGTFLWVNGVSVSLSIERDISLGQWVFSFTLNWMGHFSGSMGFQFHFELKLNGTYTGSMCFQFHLKLNGTLLWVNGFSVSLWLERDIFLGQWVFSFTLNWNWTGRISESMCFQFHLKLTGTYLWVNGFSVSLWVERDISLGQWVFSFTLKGERDVSLGQWVFSFTLGWTGHISGSMGFQFHFELNAVYLWLRGFSGDFIHCFLSCCLSWDSLMLGFSCFRMGKLVSSYFAYAAFTLFSGCLSTAGSWTLN